MEFMAIKNLYKIKLLKKIFLRIFAVCNPGNIRIKHHFTRDPLLIHSFRRKSYWFHGRDRELDSMEMFRRLIHSGAIVVEVGGHIGYISLFYKDLVGAEGFVYVFEPGSVKA
jgi:hypothetical protein